MHWPAVDRPGLPATRVVERSTWDDGRSHQVPGYRWTSQYWKAALPSRRRLQISDESLRATRSAWDCIFA